jgi:outer membrane protein OmpA-like peptidoglycan-associated protein
MKSPFKFAVTTFTSAALLTLAGCAADGSISKAGLGAIIGGATCAAIGSNKDRKTAAGAGAACALVGAGIGAYMDKQQEEMNRRLAEEQASRQLAISRESEDTIKIALASDASFGVGEDRIRPESAATYNKVAETLKNYPDTTIYIVGHTDSDGSDESNMALSKRRADNVVAFLANRGVEGSRMTDSGRGEAEPVADNSSSEGKRKNRRVDIFVKAKASAGAAQ